MTIALALDGEIRPRILLFTLKLEILKRKKKLSL